MEKQSSRNLWCACLIAFAFSANYTNHAPIAQILMKAFSFDKASAGLLTTGMFFTHAFMQIPGGMLGDKLGGRRVVIFAMSLVFLGNIGITFSDNYTELLIWKIITGFGTGASFIGGAKYIYQTTKTEKLHLYQGYYGASVLFGSGFVIFCLPQIVAHFNNNWVYGFYTTASIALVALLVWIFFAPSSHPEVHPHVKLTTMLFDKSLLLLGSVQMASFGLSIVIGTWITVLLKENFKTLNGWEISAVASLILILGIFFRPLGGKLIPVFGIKKVIIFSLLMITAGCFILAITNISFPVAIVALLILGMGCGLPYVSVFTRASQLFPGRVGVAMGLANMLGMIMILVGAPLVGKVKDITNSYSSSFIVLGLFALLICVINIFSYKNKIQNS